MVTGELLSRPTDAAGLNALQYRGRQVGDQTFRLSYQRVLSPWLQFREAVRFWEGTTGLAIFTWMCSRLCVEVAALSRTKPRRTLYFFGPIDEIQSNFSPKRTIFRVDFGRLAT